MKKIDKDSYLTSDDFLAGLDKNKIYDLLVVNGEIIVVEGKENPDYEKHE